MRVSVCGLAVSVCGFYVALSGGDSWEVVVRFREVVRPWRWGWNAFRDSGVCRGRRWRTADVWAGPVEVTRFW